MDGIQEDQAGCFRNHAVALDFEVSKFCEEVPKWFRLRSAFEDDIVEIIQEVGDKDRLSTLLFDGKSVEIILVIVK